MPTQPKPDCNNRTSLPSEYRVVFLRDGVLHVRGRFPKPAQVQMCMDYWNLLFTDNFLFEAQQVASKYQVTVPQLCKIVSGYSVLIRHQKCRCGEPTITAFRTRSGFHAGAHLMVFCDQCELANVAACA
jgi:hypothetical protein